jgi:hypothetical protein
VLLFQLPLTTALSATPVRSQVQLRYEVGWSET